MLQTSLFTPCFRYPGRASSAPLMDLFITMLSMGRSGLVSLLAQREQLFARAKSELAALASKHGERLLDTANQISMAMSLARLGPDKATELGSKLFSRCCSGSRTVSCETKQTVAGIAFCGFGAHVDAYPTPYLTVCLTFIDFHPIVAPFSPAFFRSHARLEPQIMTSPRLCRVWIKLWQKRSRN